MVNLILVPILSGILLYKFPTKIAKILMLGVQAFLIVNVFALIAGSSMTEPIYEFMGGDIPILFIALRGDRMTFILAAMTVILFASAMVYAYFEDYFTNRYMLLFMVLQGATSGIFLVDDIFTIFIFTTRNKIVISSFMHAKKAHGGRELSNPHLGLFTQGRTDTPPPNIRLVP